MENSMGGERMRRLEGKGDRRAGERVEKTEGRGEKGE